MYTGVRTAVSADAQAIAEIHASSWRVTYGGMLPQAYLNNLSALGLVSGWRRRLSTPRGRAIVAEVDGLVVGFATFGPARSGRRFSGELTMLYVSPEAEGAGIGSALIEEVETELTRQGYRDLVIWLISKNQLARRFYDHHGLVDSGKRQSDHTGGGNTELMCMAKSLGIQRR